MAKYPYVRAAMIELLGEHPPKGTQQALADAVGKSAATVSRWFAGEARPDPESWYYIAEHCGVPLDRVRKVFTATIDATIPAPTSTINATLSATGSTRSSGTADVTLLRGEVEALRAEVARGHETMTTTLGYVRLAHSAGADIVARMYGGDAA